MNYQHFYHAGNAADVFKHCVLLAILTHFKQKASPFYVMDTHAGAGMYDLTHASGQEWQKGIGALQKSVCKHPLLQNYQQLNRDLTHFAGSPWLIKQQLRPSDRSILVEQEAFPYRQLRRLFKQDPQVHIHQRDAWLTATALLPPPIRRGVVMIDPPYEQNNEFEQGISWLKAALARWSTATYLLWYPIKSRERIGQWHRQLQKNLLQAFLVLECCPWPEDVPIRLNGSGLIIINPPWQFAKTITPIMHELMTCLRQHPKGQWRYQVYYPLS